MTRPLLEVRDLTTQFFTADGVVRAVDGVSFHLGERETLGIVGESGSGKTVTSLSIMGLIENPGRIVGGRILFKGEDLTQKSQDEMRRIRGDAISMVFQDSLSSLNPTMTVGRQIERVLASHTAMGGDERRERAIELIRLMNIPEPEKRVGNYPHELSGGMRQRVLIAMALACNPSLLILDEPTTALDVTIEAQIFDLVADLQTEFDMGTILITHDLSVVASACSRVVIMYAGRIVEEGPVDELYARPLHPYTMGLLHSIPRLDDQPRTRLYSIPGEVPDLTSLPAGCNFSPRCRYAKDACRREDPALRRFGPGRRAACLRVEEIHGLAAAG